MAILSQFEYRLNLFTDAILQPLITSVVEVTLWWAIFKGANLESLGGFSADYYLAYALWGAFFARITTSWMYEFMMIDEIDSGRVNAILVRPISFYEFYLGQFMGYKLLCTIISMLVPIGVSLFITSPTDLSRLPLALTLATYYLLLVHTMSFMVASLAFFYNRIHSLPAAKNIALWVLAGEIFPLDLIPQPLSTWIKNLPFACGVFVPVGYLTGRIGLNEMINGFISVTVGIVFFALVSSTLWQAGRRRYSGTGA